MTYLSVNINKIAWLRNARDGNIPDIKELTQIIINSGAHGITVHPRPDLRHITPNDVKYIKKITKENQVEFNIEGNPYTHSFPNYPGFLSLVNSNIPDQCTLVPDSVNQITSDHGWKLTNKNKDLKEVINNLQDKNIRVSMFVDPVQEDIEKIANLGADRIELYTGPYAYSYKNKIDLNKVLDKYIKAAEFARELDLKINAGHDLNLDNLGKFLDSIQIDEVSIGHALISDSLKKGLNKTIKEYLDICSSCKI
tara:strand:- start:18832 stop:19590 length:759 start_codon:yes stop_codon:yes gene_type:complete